LSGLSRIAGVLLALSWLTGCAAPPSSAYSPEPTLSDLSGKSVDVSRAVATAPMDQTLQARLYAIMANPDQQAAALTAIKQTVYWTSNPCPTATFTWLPGLKVFDVVRFNAQGQPVAGTWRESILESGCNINLQQNVANYVTGPGEVHVIAMLPGTTQTSPIAQAHAINNAAYAAGVLHGSCDLWYVANTEYVGPEGPVTSDGSGIYKEYWTVNACGDLKRTVLHFQSFATGDARVRVDPKETTTLPQ
jgi:hypothetical protein